MIHDHFWIYLLVTAGVTYLVRMVPLVLMKGKITNRFVLSFLHYIPYAVLSVIICASFILKKWSVVKKMR